MFTGLVEEVGRVTRFEKRGQGGRLAIQARTVLLGTELGDSIAVSGACLTVVQLRDDGFTVDCMPETLTHTTLGGKSPGAAVNLERSLSVGARLGGHFVLGHVDAIADILQVERQGEFLVMTFSLPAVVASLVAPKGSVAIEGISLTVIDVLSGRFSIGVIPHTLVQTSLAQAKAGDKVNVEADVLARYVSRVLDAGGEGGSDDAVGETLTEEFLREKGFA
ncbi:MAG: riboflavin synthase [Thermoleophilia bacterium]|nr:riboflavin synthase [Thermoleophilia bacterium]